MLKQQLFDLYSANENRINQLKSTYSNQILHGPYFCSPSTLYQTQKTPLLFIGQETYGWDSKTNVEDQMTVYENFNVGTTYTKRSPFWNMIRRLETLFNYTTYSCAALNINRFDVNGSTPSANQIPMFAKLDDLLASEITILNPKICVFFTGDKSDNRLKQLYPGLEFQEAIPGLTYHSIAYLKHENLPKHTYRTYHPAFLRRSKLESRFIEFMSSLAFKLNQHS